MATKSKTASAAGNEATKSKAASAEETEVAPSNFQEWQVQINLRNVDGKTEYDYEKLKLLRPVVKITQDTADVLNHGVLHGGNRYGKMYFKAD